jgi:hypothetical protein
VNFTNISTVGLSGAEIPAFDPTQNLMFVTAGELVEIVDVNDPASPVPLAPLDVIANVTELGDGSPFTAKGANSVAYRDGVVAVAVEADPDTDPGAVALFSADDLADAIFTPLNVVQVNAKPDMLTFTPEGLLLVANEGESDGEDNDPSGPNNPEGSISVIDVRGGASTATVATADFTSFNSQADDLAAEGVRLFPQVFDGEITVEVDGEDVRLTLDDLVITSEGIEGWLVDTQEGVTVALDTHLTPELLREGLAREIVNRIQNLRKQAGFEVTDRIHVVYSATPDLGQAVADFGSWIRNETLAVELEEAVHPDGELVKAFDVDDERVTIALRRVVA